MLPLLSPAALPCLLLVFLPAGPLRSGLPSTCSTSGRCSVSARRRHKWPRHDREDTGPLWLRLGGGGCLSHLLPRHCGPPLCHSPQLRWLLESKRILRRFSQQRHGLKRRPRGKPPPPPRLAPHQDGALHNGPPPRCGGPLPRSRSRFNSVAQASASAFTT